MAIRLLCLWQASDYPLYHNLVEDEILSHRLGEGFAKGDVSLTPYMRCPLYYMFLGAIYRGFGADALAARIAQSFVAALSPMLVCLIACRLFDRTIGLAAGLLSALYWTFIFFSFELLDVTLEAPLWLALTYVVITSSRLGRWRWAGTGLILAVGSLARPNFLVGAPVLAMMAGLEGWREGAGRNWARFRQGLFNLSAFAIASSLGVAGVVVRNYVVAGETVWLGPWGSAVFYAANRPGSDAKSISSPPIDPAKVPPGVLKDLAEKHHTWLGDVERSYYLFAASDLGRPATWREVEDFYRRAALDYLRKHPGKFMTDTLQRIAYMFNSYEYPMNKDLYWYLRSCWPLRALSWLHFGILCPLGVLGLLLTVGRRPWPEGLAGYLAMLCVVALPLVLTFVVARYRVPLGLLLTAVVPVGVRELIGLAAPDTSWRRRVAVVGLVSLLLALSNSDPFEYRRPFQAYLIYDYALSCQALGEKERLAEAVEEMDSEFDRGRALVAARPGVLEFLYVYHRNHENWPKALKYGEGMLRPIEKASPSSIASFVDLLVRFDQREPAAIVLREMAKRHAKAASAFHALALYRFGDAYADRAALEQAERHFSLLARAAPHEKPYADGLALVRRRLAQIVATRPASRE